MCKHWVHTSQVDPAANYSVDSFYLFHFNLWQWRQKISVEKTKCICVCIINHVINDSSVPLTLCSTCWTNHWRDPKLACFSGQERIALGHRSEDNEYRVDYIVQWCIFHSHLSYAIEVCLVNRIDNFNPCKSKLALLNSRSRQLSNKKENLYLPHKC